MDLLQKKCQPCEGDVSPLTKEQINELLNQVDNWSLDDKGHLTKEFKFNDFRENMSFINKVADLAESEDHHPDFQVSYSKTKFEIWTHAINGLSDNDFILAAKIDQLVK